mmetsp:Transcript_51536/g.76404  ORF Transcript_51536/g.76404 Transcript_51536/m.76404 type:complete len:256 (+) Transcript_51536:512-1279(+)
MRAKHQPLIKAAPIPRQANHGIRKTQYHQVNVRATTYTMLPPRIPTDCTAPFETSQINPSGIRINPTSRTGMDWCDSHKESAVLDMGTTSSEKEFSNGTSVVFAPNKIVFAINTNDPIRVLSRMRATHTARNMLCRGQRNACITEVGIGSDVTDPTAKENDSALVAIVITKFSGVAMTLSGSAQRGSCFAHHPLDGFVTFIRERYAERVSAAAAQRRGIAARPLGVRSIEFARSPPPVAGVEVGVVGTLLGAAVP